MSTKTFADLAPGDRFLCGADQYIKFNILKKGKLFYQDDNQSLEINAINAFTLEVAWIDPLSEVVPLV